MSDFSSDNSLSINDSRENCYFTDTEEKGIAEKRVWPVKLLSILSLFRPLLFCIYVFTILSDFRFGRVSKLGENEFLKKIVV